jgi:hypothetical protein
VSPRRMTRCGQLPNVVVFVGVSEVMDCSSR